MAGLADALVVEADDDEELGDEEPDNGETMLTRASDGRGW